MGCIMPTFGDTNIQSNTSADFGTHAPRGQQVSPASSGILTDIYLYIVNGAAGLHAKVGIYSDLSNAPHSLLATSASDEITSNGWHDFKGFNLPITAGTKYWLAWMADNTTLHFAYDLGGALNCNNEGSTYPTFPDPYGDDTQGGGPWNANVSIYGVYTPSVPAFKNVRSGNNLSASFS